MGATFSRLKNWIAEILTYADINAEIDNILTNLTPAGIDDYSANATAMRTQTDPGESGSESLATSLAGELERLRFAIAEMKGTTYWYQTADTSLEELSTALGTTLLANRISSGAMRSGSSQPLFLIPAGGSTRTVTLNGATTTFSYYINSTAYTISSNVTATSLTLAPSSNNTCLVNMPGVLDQEWTKRAGEFGTTIQVDGMGSEISALVGKLAAFKLAGAATEYFIANVDSSTQLSNARRGYFFDSASAPVTRTAFTDNDTITLLKLTWIYANTSGAIVAGYTNPYVQADTPTSPAIGDYWFDTANNTWKVYDLTTTWVSANLTLIGVCAQDTSGCIVARGFDFYKSHSEDSTVSVTRSSATQVSTKNRSAEITVYGSTVKFAPAFATWNTSTDFDSGVTEAASTEYYLYVKESGDTVISDIAPFDRTSDLRGLYHPHHTWRCVGQVYNNASQDFVACIDYADKRSSNYKITAEVAASALTLTLHANPLSRFVYDDLTTTGINDTCQVPCTISLTIPSTATLGHPSNFACWIHAHLLVSNGTPYLGIATIPYASGTTVTSVAVSTGSDSNTNVYTQSALTSVPCIIVGRMTSTQVTAGTWAAVPTSIVSGKFDIEPIVAVYSSSVGQTIDNIAAEQIQYDTRIQDNYNCVTTGASWAFTTPRAAWYEIKATAQLAGGGGWEAGERMEMIAYDAGSIIANMGRFDAEASTGNAQTVVGVITYYANAGVALDVRLYQDSDAGIALVNDGRYNRITVREILHPKVST